MDDNSALAKAVEFILFVVAKDFLDLLLGAHFEARGAPVLVKRFIASGPEGHPNESIVGKLTEAIATVPLFTPFNRNAVLVLTEV